jgi:hypothetical protein
MVVIVAVGSQKENRSVEYGLLSLLIVPQLEVLSATSCVVLFGNNGRLGEIAGRVQNVI